jgi:hypothetical protein
MSVRGAQRLLLAMLLLVVAAAATGATSDGKSDPEPRPSVSLDDLAARFRIEADLQRNARYQRLRATTNGPQGRLNASHQIALMGIDARGYPRFYRTDNLEAAITVNTDQVWPGGGGGFSLTGANGVGELGIWDFDPPPGHT